MPTERQTDIILESELEFKPYHYKTPMTQSNEPTIEQMNEAIGVFMGGFWKEFKSGNFRQKRFYYKDEAFAWVKSPENLNYHKEWNELMPVVEKIETVEVNGGKVLRSATDLKILYRACIIEYSPDEESGDTNEEITIQTQGGTKLEAVHKAVYQFITWYNQNQQTTTNE